MFMLVVTKLDPTLIVPGQSENNRIEFHNVFMLKEGQIISLWFKQKKVVGGEILLILNIVVYAHNTQNLHLKNQCCIHVWNGDFSFGQPVAITLS